ncbi:DUF7146 domain-containing protein [Loktanella sp. Alg231-35]|uniref:DUF7146 domain-containing protein n=1 Tax=Loktanella sp. Alg231-35 TaxID=1922220 RepID=UPI000D55A55A|nr:toprim domain-containing protein [Loktanella sp. Alg231-35]
MTNAKDLTHALNGRWFGHYGLAFCPAHENTRTPALSLRNTERGDLLTYCHAGCSFADVRDALRTRGLLDGLRTDWPHSQNTRTYTEAPSAAQRAEAIARAKTAHRLWEEAQPISNSPAARYLKSRGVTCNLPPTLRYHARCPHPTGGRLPAMIARVNGAMSFALHRTYLRYVTYVGNDNVRKADIAPAKAMLGPCRGGAVRLSSQTCFDDGGPLVVTEGIENGLSLLSGLMDQPATVWAALSTSGITSLSLPRRPGHLIIAADGDEAGRRAARKLSLRADSLGWRISHLTPPDEQDWNDVLMQAKEVTV